MIWKFLKEYRFWYYLYFFMWVMFLVNFCLYKLPLNYFFITSSLNVTILLLISIWKFIQFKRKMTLLNYFKYLEEIDSLKSPTEEAYQGVIENLVKEEAAQALVSKSQLENLQSLIKMWSHQMKVPLSALSLMVQTDNLDKKEVQQQLIRLQNYLDILLTYMKFSQNKDDYRFEICDVKSIVTDLVKKYRVAFLAKELSVNIEGDWQLKSDKKWLSFAISQILDNAVKYSKDGSEINVIIDASSIKILDNGIGILPEDLPRLFDEGFTGFNGHEHQKATGLGLYMTKQILDQLNLSIKVDSQIDQGTCVTIFKD